MPNHRDHDERHPRPPHDDRAETEGDRAGDQGREGKVEPERQAELDREEGRRVRADAIKGGGPEGDEAGAEDHGEAHAQDDIDPCHDEEVEQVRALDHQGRQGAPREEGRKTRSPRPRRSGTSPRRVVDLTEHTLRSEDQDDNDEGEKKDLRQAPEELKPEARNHADDDAAQDSATVAPDPTPMIMTRKAVKMTVCPMPGVTEKIGATMAPAMPAREQPIVKEKR